jgi:hypothetical protein
MLLFTLLQEEEKSKKNLGRKQWMVLLLGLS